MAKGLDKKKDVKKPKKSIKEKKAAKKEKKNKQSLLGTFYEKYLKIKSKDAYKKIYYRFVIE